MTTDFGFVSVETEPRAAYPRPRIVASHEQDDAARSDDSNADPPANSVTGFVRSAIKSAARALSFPTSARIFQTALDASGLKQADVAAAVGVSTTIVGRWCRGEATIPADAVWILIKRLPAMGVELLLICVGELPADFKAAFKERVVMV